MEKMRVMVSEFKGQVEFFLQPQMMAELAKGLPSSPEMLVPALLSFLGEKVSQSWHFREHEHWAKTDCVRTYDQTRAVCRATPPVTAPPKTLTLNSKFSSVNPAMDPQKVIPIRAKNLRVLMKTIARSLTIQSLAPISMMIYVQKIFNSKVNIPNGK